MTKVNTAEIPSRAKHLFMKLYCEKKGGKTKENIHNASQSWLSLSLTKKQHFYDTVSSKTAVEKAQLIIQTEPFLRAKYPSLVRKQKQKDAVCQEHQNNIESDPGHVTIDDHDEVSVHDDTIMEFDYTSNSFLEENNVDKVQVSEVHNLQKSYKSVIDEDTDSAEHDRNKKDLENIPQSEPVLPLSKNKAQMSEVQNLQNSYMSVIDEDTDTAEENDTNEKDAENIPLSEPVLPITKTGRELFDLLKTRNGTSKPYESLTSREKNYYGRAVCAIKKDYVKKYKEYLESLSPRQLFDYYMKIF